jgi:hypothetical protein
MFALELSMKKRIKNWVAGFSVIPAIIAFGFRLYHMIYCHSDKSYPCLVGIGLNSH